MKTHVSAGLLVSLLLSTATVSAGGPRNVQVEVTNLTNAVYFTPLLLAAHENGQHLFQVGEPASPALQAMAEGGDLSGLIHEVEAGGGVYVDNPAGGLLEPGGTASATLSLKHRTRFLSIGAMLLPTNDGFVGADSLKIPLRRGVHTYYLKGYDAGTEANDEIVNGGGAPGSPGIPADPGANAGSGASGVTGADYNGMVHVHRGIVGDADPAGGTSDLDAATHRWLNPVAKLTITVGRPFPF